MAWRVRDPSRGVLAHVIATGAAVALVTTSAGVAAVIGRDHQDKRGKRLPVNRKVTRAIMMMLLVGALAVAVELSKSSFAR